MRTVTSLASRSADDISPVLPVPYVHSITDVLSGPPSSNLSDTSKMLRCYSLAEYSLSFFFRYSLPMFSQQYFSPLLFACFALLASLLLSLGGRSARAQPARSDTVGAATELPRVVVTATRRLETVRHTGRRVAVITAEDIAAQPALSLDEVLRSAPGVELQSRAGFGVQSDYTMRGSSFKGVLLLLDGVPLNDPQTGHYLSDFPVPLSEVARIEILRGPAAALYGPNAVGGVINVITHAGRRAEAGEDRAATAAWTGEGSMQYGAHALYDAGAAARYERGRTAFGAATAWQGTDGEPISAPDGTPVRSGGDRLRTDFERQTHTLAARRGLGDELGGATLYARVGMDRRNFNAYHFYTDFDSDRARSDNQTYWAQARLRNSTQQPTRWTAQVAAKQHQGLYVYNPAASGGSARDYSRKATAQLHASRRVAEGLRLTGGASGEWRGIDSATMGDHRNLSGGVFVSGRWQASRPLWIGGSARANYDDAYGLELAPQASLAYTPAGYLTLRAAVARAVRAPTYTERYIDTKVEEPAGNLGNPALDAERAWSYEAGADLYPLPGLTLHATAFYRDTQDLIDYAKRPEEELFVARNVLNARQRGLELEAKARRSLGEATRLHLTSACTLLGSDLSTDSDAEYKYTPSHARHLVQGTARLRAGRATLGLRGLWKDRRARRSYGVLHGRAAYRVPVRGARLGLSLEVRNLFDHDYADVFDAPMPGRWWILGVSLKP
jgi:outer membrane cobalamin receptor